MASDIRITDTRANAAMDALFGTSANTGILRIYAATATEPQTGGIPDGEPNAGGVTHGSVLAELTMNGTAFGSAAASTAYSRITANSITQDSSANNSGDAVYWILWDSAGTTALAQGTAGEAADSTDMTLDNKTISSGAAVSCSALYFQLPKGWTT